MLASPNARALQSQQEYASKAVVSCQVHEAHEFERRPGDNQGSERNAYDAVSEMREVPRRLSQQRNRGIEGMGFPLITMDLLLSMDRLGHLHKINFSSSA
jgi:hypothetical protein